MKKILTLLLLCASLLAAAEAFLQCVHVFSTSKKIPSVTPARKILCLGDSFTYGSGADKNSSYPSQLEYLLNANNLPEKFQVINLAATGISSSMIANELDGYLKKYDPDIAIILAGANDHWNMKDSNILDVKNRLRAGISGFFMRLNIFLFNFRTYRLLQLAFHEIACKINKTEKNSGETITLSNIDEPSLVQELVKFNCRKMGQVLSSPLRKFQLFLQTYPDHPKLINAAIRQTAHDYGIHLIDQESLFPKADRLSEFLSSDGWHLNAKGYNQMAVNIYNDFLRRGIVKNRLAVNYHPVLPRTFPDEIIATTGGWKFNLSSIARHPEKLINLRNAEWYFHTNNVAGLPEIELDRGEYVLQITARGTPVDRIYPLLGFYYKSAACAGCPKNGINKVFVNEEWANYFSGKIKIDDKQKIIFYVSFENDEFRINPEKTEDRNLFISQIILKPSKK
jgi:lysophospholipase L1-like esterase